ncbi:solute carrier organic anion transporter family member 74D [Episyrphus balteatus]|uniref:solute carrier organic anion transporter family member 74D n=1 Tax=Episyrphus balteatus TaxID=286459 RepID=UPI002485D7AB|nr:solute carrier organic anion transporter family member 74D [Episyrphus balteatus]XP_055844652.1 solute carrier organic anion transporter family member 74D [Episyrphus balteatus]
MSPGNNEGPNTPSILEIDLKNTKKKKWLNMHPNSGQNNEATDPHHNNHRNGKCHPNDQQQQNGTKNGNATNGYNGNTNGTNGTNGTNNGVNGNGNARRDSGHVWSPLLQTESTPPDPTTELYSPSNNNEWKDSEEINNLKNGLHIVKGNNNGSMMNGKNGLGLSDKYDEQDPLTGGLYRPQIIPTRSDELSDDDGADLPEVGSGCGLFGFRPRWARNFASTHVFMVIFLLAWVLQGMFMTYFVSVITTIEKLFQIKSRTTGLLLSASEMGQISTAMLLTYYAGRGHRPRWIACGMVIFAIASFSCALPHFIFGKQLLHSTAFMNGGGAGVGSVGSSFDGGKQHLLNSSGLGLTMSSVSSDMNMNLCLVSGNGTHNSNSDCEEDVKLEQASHSKITVIVLCIFFVSLLSSGIGQTAVATLGIPYIDDNVASRQSPIYMAITIGVRILGPTAGFIVGSFCTRWYVNFTVPGFDATDPRWIGAWWLGPVIIGSLMMLASLAMFSFPKQLRGRRLPDAASEKSALSEPEEKPRLRDFPKTVRRQLSNDILMFRTAASVFHLLPIAGLTTFLPKYLETQFRLPAADANLIAAFGGILVMGIGIFISGIVILKLKPTAKSVAAWIAFTAFVYACGMVILMFVGCNMNDFAGLKKDSTIQTTAVFEPTCNLNCTCDMEKFAPICGSDGKTYFSSCHAGCTSFEVRGNRTVYSNCECIPDVPVEEKAYEATSGYCDSSCKNFVAFILIFAGCVFMHSTSEVGSMLLIMRCTHPKDKAMAMGVIQSAIGLFGNVPCPIIYGAVVDSACLVWKTVCGKHGACSLYNVEAFRHNFLGITAGIMFLAFLMDLVVWSKAHRIDITPEEEEGKTDPESVKPITAPDTTV